MKIIKLSATSSTNDYLLELLRNDSLEQPHLVYTLDQTAGRGQQGSSWFGEAGKNLAMSLFWPFDGLSVDRIPALGWALSLAVRTLLQNQLSGEIQLKWPNDIMSDQRKLAGMLVEPQLRGGLVRSVVVGLGVNVNNTVFPEQIRAISLRQLADEEQDAEALCLDLASCMMEALKGLPHANKEQLRADYLQAQMGLLEWRAFQIPGGKRVEARIADISPQGALVLEDRNGVRTTYGLKEIRFCF